MQTDDSLFVAGVSPMRPPLRPEVGHPPPTPGGDAAASAVTPPALSPRTAALLAVATLAGAAVVALVLLAAFEATRPEVEIVEGWDELGRPQAAARGGPAAPAAGTASSSPSPSTAAAAVLGRLIWGDPAARRRRSETRARREHVERRDRARRRAAEAKAKATAAEAAIEAARAAVRTRWRAGGATSEEEASETGARCLPGGKGARAHPSRALTLLSNPSSTPLQPQLDAAAVAAVAAALASRPRYPLSLLLRSLPWLRGPSEAVALVRRATEKAEGGGTGISGFLDRGKTLPSTGGWASVSRRNPTRTTDDDDDGPAWVNVPPSRLEAFADRLRAEPGRVSAAALAAEGWGQVPG